MSKILTMMVVYFKSEHGATAVEYGFFVAGIALAVAIVAFSLGDQLADAFGALGDAVDEGMDN